MPTEVKVDQPLATKPIYAPINGKEARQILIASVTEKVNKIGLFKEGLAFHNIHMMYSLVVTCTPTDCPVPQTEFEKAIGAKDFEDNKDWSKTDNAIKILEARRIKLIEGIDSIDKILSVINPIINIEADLDASNSPSGADELRLDHDLLLPREVTTSLPDGSTKKIETYVKIDKANVVKPVGAK